MIAYLSFLIFQPPLAFSTGDFFILSQEPLSCNDRHHR